VACTETSEWKAVAHAAIEQRVGNRHDAHALVVRHVGLHEHARLAFGHAARREVHGLEEAVAAARADGGERPVVGERGFAIDHGAEAGGVGRHHLVLRQSALQTQARHAEVRILIGELEVARVVSRLGDTPGQAELLAVFDLALHDQRAGVRQQAATRRAQHQVRHQVLEHRARPGHERGAGADRRDGAAEPEPVTRGDVALRDGDEAREPRFGGEQVVTGVVERTVRGAIPDRQQLALPVEQEPEFHRARQRERVVGQPLEMLDDETRGVARQQVAAPAVDGAACRLHPVDEVGVAVDVGFGRQRAHQVHQRGGAFGGLRQVVELRIEQPIARPHGGLQIRERRFDQLARDGLAGREAEFAQCLAGEIQRVRQADHGLGSRLRSCCHWRNAPAIVIRWAARLPESTEET
jgi:hypothetical protein